MDRPFPAYDGDEPYVFVCYAHKDARVVYEELSWLRDRGVNIWYDEGITPGEEFPERLGKAILNASLVLFYVSPCSVASRHCRNEVFFSLDRDTPVLAIHLERTELPPGLALSTGTAQAIMRYELPEAVYHRKLLTGIRDHSDRDHRIEVGQEALLPSTPWQRARPLAWPLAISLIAGALALGGVQVKNYLDREERIRWARDEALPKIREMLQVQWRDFTEPYELAVQAEAVIPDDPELQAILEAISVRVAVDSEPRGATVSYKNYNTPEADWVTLGTTPLTEQRLPVGVFRWKFERTGFEPVLAAASSWDISLGSDDMFKANDLHRTLDTAQQLPPGMVRVQGAATGQGAIGDFYIDRYEVTNVRFQEFVDAGGYQKPEYWQHPFIDDGRELSFAEAMSRFVDQTGRPGPSLWIGGHFPDDLGDHPVSGVSWYEAAAFARWAGRELPTADHWGLARGEHSPVIDWPQLGGFATFAPFSNLGSTIGGTGTVPVGSLPGVTAYGAYDMAGNVREWCSNDTAIGKVVRGGAWSDNTYDFGKIQQAPAMLRTPGYGFRTARYADREDIPKAVFGPVQTSQKLDLRAHRPVSDEIFSVYLNQFAYDKDGLDAQPIAVDDGHPDWVMERISVAAPYGDERLIINLFLPRSATPPFQTVIYFPGSAALFTASSEDLSDYYEIPLFLGFLMRSGRAVAFPVYQGTFERRDDRYLDIYYGQPSHAYSEYVTQLVKDLRRTVDYLETRDDVDDQRLAYYGMSWGAEIGGVILAVEERMRIAIVMGGGIINAGLPEVNELNYLPHVTVPVLMMNGRYDSLISYESAVLPMFEMIATPAEHKVIKSYPTDHIPSKVDYVTETLNWLDKYFGPVRTVGQPDG